MFRMQRLAGWTGALVFGLPVALLAHLITFGDEHVVGGGEHGLVVVGAWALTAIVLVGAAASATLSSRRTQSGSVVSARLQAYLPSWAALASTAFLWYLAVERLESPHVSIGLPILAALALLAYLAIVVGRAVLRAFATLAVAWFAPGRMPLSRPAPRLAYAAPVPALAAPVRRRFARPPPRFS